MEWINYEVIFLTVINKINHFVFDSKFAFDTD